MPLTPICCHSAKLCPALPTVLAWPWLLPRLEDYTTRSLAPTTCLAMLAYLQMCHLPLVALAAGAWTARLVPLVLFAQAAVACGRQQAIGHSVNLQPLFARVLHLLLSVVLAGMLQGCVIATCLYGFAFMLVFKICDFVRRMKLFAELRTGRGLYYALSARKITSVRSVIASLALSSNALSRWQWYWQLSSLFSSQQLLSANKVATVCHKRCYVRYATLFTFCTNWYRSSWHVSLTHAQVSSVLWICAALQLCAAVSCCCHRIVCAICTIVPASVLAGTSPCLFGAGYASTCFDATVLG